MSYAVDADRGIVWLQSHHSVAVTMDRLEALLKERGIIVFARIDFSSDAAKAGLTMRPEQLLIFGNPKAGTPLMQAAPIAGLDLPLKALVWEDSGGSIWIAYNEAQYLIRRHDLLPALGANLTAVIPIIERAAQQ
ncbi:MAG: DUF302 domain-containing protein [Steroidobacteraceae bacterium]|jgi:uncharacterized protein (DUF302 family)